MSNIIKKTFTEIKYTYKIIPANQDNNGIVICTATIRAIPNYFRKVYPMLFFLYPPVQIVQGVAKCSLEDTFNEKIGKQIALSKAKIKAYNKMQNFYNNIYYNLKKAMKDVDYVYTNNLKAELNEDKHLKYITKSSINTEKIPEIVEGNVLYIKQNNKVLPYIVFKTNEGLAVMSYYYPLWRYLKDIPIKDILGIQSIVSFAIVDEEKIVWSKYPINELMELIDKSTDNVEKFFRKYEY